MDCSQVVIEKRPGNGNSAESTRSTRCIVPAVNVRSPNVIEELLSHETGEKDIGLVNELDLPAEL